MLAAIANGQGVVTSAQGEKGSPASLPLQIDLTKADANVINKTEITENVTNECGRTLLAGNIDIGQNTEDQIANKTVTSVTKAGTLTMTIDEIDANGAGPFTCDMDQTSNSLGAGQTPLTVKQASKSGISTLTITMPADMACIGGSTGNICTVRCFNTVAAGPFGGCVAVSQSDITPNVNTPDNIATAQTLDGINKQIAQNNVDLPETILANQAATSENDEGVKAVDNVLGIDSVAQATAGVPDVAAATAAAAAVATTAAAAGTGKKVKGGGGGKGAAAAAAAAKGAKGGKAGKNNRRAARVFIS